MAFTVGELLVATGPYTAESSPVYLADLEDVSDESPGDGQALVWDGEEWTFGDVGSMTSFTLAGDSGTNQTIADGNTLTILGGRGLATATSATDTITINLPTGTSGQVLKHNGSAWVAGTDTDTTYTAGTGLSLGGTQFSLSHLGIQSLTDPGADRILFWDESENASKWLTIGTNLAISGTTINATDTNTTYSAGTGLNLATTTFSLSHLGIQSLTDPGADRILFWDESENASKWLTIGTNLEISGTTLNASASAGITNFTLAGDSGTPQTISDGNTLTISGSGGITAVAGATDTVTIGLPSGSSGQVLKHNGSAWVAGTDTDTTYTAGTGLALVGTAFSLSHLGIQSLTDPNADRILFWDDSEGASKWLELGTNLAISGTTINATDTNTTYSAGTGLNLATTTFNHSNSVSAQSTARLDKIAYDAQGHVTSSSAAALGDLSNVNASSPSNGQVLKYSTSSSKWEAATDETGSGSLPSGSSTQTLRHSGSAWIATSNVTNDGSTLVCYGSGSDVGPLDITHSSNAAANDEIYITYSSSDGDGGAQPVIGSVGFEIETMSGNDISNVDFVVKNKQSGGAATERFRVAGTTLTNSSGKILLSAMADSLPPVVSAPAGSGSSGTANQIAFDSSYFYVCTGSNTWKRIAWTAW